MMLEQPLTPLQFSDGLTVRSGNDGPAAEQQTAHVFGHRHPGSGGLHAQSFVFYHRDPHHAPALKPCASTVVSLHSFSCLFESAISNKLNALRESGGAAFGSFVAGVSQLPICKEEHPAREAASFLFPRVYPCAFSSLLRQV